jgi:nitrosocyanin
MEKKLFAGAFVAMALMGAGCSSNATLDANVKPTDIDVAGQEDMDMSGHEGIAVGEPNPSAPAEGEVKVDVDAGTKVSTGAVKEFTVTGDNFAFAPNTMTVKKGDTVKVTFKNAEGFHDFKLDEFGVSTKQIGANTSETVTFVADKAGSFEYYCSVGQHRAMGMKGTLTVTE